LRSPGVDKVLITRIQRKVGLSIQNGVTSGVSSLALAGRKVIEALPCDVGSEDVLDLLLVLGLLESVGQRSDPREGTLGGQVFKEYGALVSIAENSNSH